MNYEKKFNKDRTKVTITTPEGSRGLPLLNIKDMDYVTMIEMAKEKIIEVVKKEEIYEQIKNGESINLKDKYVEKFSLYEYRKKSGLNSNARVILKDFDAEGAFFDGGADFSYAIFKGDISFRRVVFMEGSVSFNNAIFMEGNINFSAATFEKGDVDFTAVNFGRGNVYFVGATFGEGVVSFGNANFGDGNIDFRYTNFGKGYVDFMLATFGKGDVDFRGTNFGKGFIAFNFLKVQGDWDMRGVEADVIDFYGSLIHGTIDLTGVKINRLELTDAQLTGKIFISSRELGLERGLKQQKDVINIQDNTIHREKRDQFCLLKENFRNLGHYEDEDKAYYWFKYHEIRAEKEFEKEDSLWDKIKKTFTYGFKWLFFERMGKYGTSPRNVALSMGVVWLIWTLIYFWKFYLIGMKSPNLDSLNILNKFGLSMYHSAITFLTIGYGDIYPMGCLKFWSSVEGFFGLFLMSYFTVSFVRKVLR